jgi:hypothetical protein
MDRSRPEFEMARWHLELTQTCGGVDIIHAFEDRIKRESDPEKLRALKFELAREYEAQGNQAAADVLYLQDPADQADRWVHQLCRDHTKIDIIPTLERALEAETNPYRQRSLKFALAFEHQRVGNHMDAEVIYLRLFDEDPDEAAPLTFLANQKLYYENQPEAALPIIDRAIAAAFRSGHFRRDALMVKARIAVQLQAYQVVEDVLKQIMELKREPGAVDVTAKRDFLDRLPPDAISEEVFSQYDEFSRRK